jgi:hypothetical protein
MNIDDVDELSQHSGTNACGAGGYWCKRCALSQAHRWRKVETSMFDACLVADECIAQTHVGSDRDSTNGVSNHRAKLIFCFERSIRPLLSPPVRYCPCFRRFGFPAAILDDDKI